MLQLFMILKNVHQLYLAGSKIMFKFQSLPDYNVLIYIDSDTRRPPILMWVPILMFLN